MAERRGGAQRQATRQAEQARLMDDARKLPGVREALDVYERLQGGTARIEVVRDTTRYATGGNG